MRFSFGANAPLGAMISADTASSPGRPRRAQEPGKHDVTVSVRSADGRTASTAFTITVTRPPVPPVGEEKAKELQKACAKQLGVPVALTNSIGMISCSSRRECSTMGSPELIDAELKAHGDESWYKAASPGEGPQHRVPITQPFGWL